jgi:hypothetical protein
VLTRRRPGVALLPLLGAMLYVAAWAAGLMAGAHEVGVPHVRCVQHGELSHLVQRAIVATKAASAVCADDQRTLDTRNGAVSDGHEHCPLAAVIDQSARQAPESPTGTIVAPEALAPPTRAQAAATPAGRLLRAAPKTSPPSA